MPDEGQGKRTENARAVYWSRGRSKQRPYEERRGLMAEAVKLTAAAKAAG